MLRSSTYLWLGIVACVTTRLVGAEIDFSSCGYQASETAIPLVPIRAVVTAAARDDDRPQIQAAIDYVSSLEPNAAGFRGAVLIERKGVHPTRKSPNHGIWGRAPRRGEKEDILARPRPHASPNDTGVRET